jgi:hypothetical protein
MDEYDDETGFIEAYLYYDKDTEINQNYHIIKSVNKLKRMEIKKKII